MARFMRAYFEGKLKQWSLTIDFILGDDLVWIERVRTTGWWGKMDGVEMWPFMLKPGGVIDFGGDLRTKIPKDIRFASIDIAGKPMILGNSFVLRNEGEKLFYVLRSLREISELVT